MLRAVIFLFTSLFATLFTMGWSLFITLAGFVKFIIPVKQVSTWATVFANFMLYGWTCCLAFVLKRINHVQWDIEGLENLHKKKWYLLISNHKSWSDIVILSALFRHHIPMNKYFLKQQLIWVPFVGIACWALDMPFMRRYTHKQLIKNPHLRGKDIETTRRSCEKFRLQPTTIVNFVEGSRFTNEKSVQTRSPYQNLLAPKAAGIAFALNTLGEQFDTVLNVTLFYPDNDKLPFIDLLCGKMRRVVVRVELLPVTKAMRGDYMHDKVYKRSFQQWLNQVWLQKDQQLTALKQRYWNKS